MVTVAKHIKDPKISLDTKNKPTEISDDKLKSSMNYMILDQEVKQYVIKKAFIKRNLNHTIQH